MAGGAIIVTQRERADKYNGRFTIFTFVAIICGATTGLVRIAWPFAAAVNILLGGQLSFASYKMTPLFSYYSHLLIVACVMQLLGYDNGEWPLPMGIQQNPTQCISWNKLRFSAA